MLQPVLLAIGLLLGLALTALLSGEVTLARPERARVHGEQAQAPLPDGLVARTAEQKPLCQKAGSAALVRLASLGESLPRPLLRQPHPGRGRFQPDTQAVPRAVRERQEALIATAAQVMRCSQAPVSAGYLADRPPLVTRPPRGPPAPA